MNNIDIDYGPLQLHIDKIQIEVANQEEQDEVARWFEWAGYKPSSGSYTTKFHYNWRFIWTSKEYKEYNNGYMCTNSTVISFSKWKQRVSEDWRQCKMNGAFRQFTTSFEKVLTIGKWYNVTVEDNDRLGLIGDDSKQLDGMMPERFTAKNLFPLTAPKPSRKIVKYVFKAGMEKYTKAVVRLEGNMKIGSAIETHGIDANDKPTVVKLLKEYGVLDEWFEPVYEPDKPLFKEITVSGRVFRIEKGKITTDTCLDGERVEARLEAWREITSMLTRELLVGRGVPEELKIQIGTTWYNAKQMSSLLQEYDNFQKQFNETPNSTSNGDMPMAVSTDSKGYRHQSNING